MQLHPITVNARGSAASYSSSDDISVLPAITVDASNNYTTEGTHSYTASSANTATKLNLSLRETPQSVKVLTREYLDDTNTNSLQEMLNGVTGLSTNRMDERQYPTARGFDVDYFLYDGVPSYDELDNAIDPDLSLYDRVELVKGANGLMTGAGNPAIAINMIRKHANAKEFTGRLNTSYGSWNAWSSSADLSAPLNSDGSIRGRVVIKHEDTDSFANQYNRTNNLVYGVIDADFSDKTYLSVGASYQNLERTGVKWGGLPAFYDDGTRTNIDHSKTVTADWTYWNTDTTTAFVTLKQNLFNDVNLNMNYSYREIKNETALLYLWSSGLINKATDSSDALYPYSDQKNITQNNADAYFSIPFTLGGLEQQIITGFMYNQSKTTDAYWGSPNTDSNTIDFDDYVSTQLTSSISNTNASADTKTTQTGAYLAGKFTLLEPLKLITGVRLSNWKYESADGDGNRKFNHEITPYAGLVFDFLNNYSWYASYTGIFKPQDKRDSNGTYIDPIKGKSYETGLKAVFFDEKLNASLSIFRTQQDNLAEIIDGEHITINGQQVDVYRSVDGVTSKGFEIELDGEVTDNWNLSLGVAHFSAKDANGNQVQTKSSRTTANLFSKYQWDKFSLGGGLNYKSKYYTDTNYGRITQDAFVIANVMAAYQIDKNIKVQLNVNNIFDKEYYDGIGADGMVYGTPRNATLSLKYDF
ncbi:TonB-dependent siderophore receptor [Acinetobacter qingfengensis]|uniref:TonB-dependent receptor n=2 Tax=Acinetobacter qingfengensis TaxID=1262585 RepID=A0A1E7REX2_9GAMM|nr:TonB-dependent siderophore receptor [Acinetobacter qingfengensis]KAA8735726.1 TonB-dependent siderophore receptor [Acinetobacter qingfengensis]OEY97950.1 TonB-dependent receptor [Acinetobacter qingfengensis]